MFSHSRFDRQCSPSKSWKNCVLPEGEEQEMSCEQIRFRILHNMQQVESSWQKYVCGSNADEECSGHSDPWNIYRTSRLPIIGASSSRFLGQGHCSADADWHSVYGGSISGTETRKHRRSRADYPDSLHVLFAAHGCMSVPVASRALGRCGRSE